MSEQICLLSDLIIKPNSSERDGLYEYSILVNGKTLNMKLSRYSEAWDLNFGYLETPEDVKKISGALKDIKYILRSLILNGKWNTNNYDVLTKKIVFEQLKFYDYPKTAEDKLNNLFNYLYKLQKYDSEKISLEDIYTNDWEKLFFKNEDEFQFYLTSLAEYDYIDLKNQTADGTYLHANFTYKGLMQSVMNENSGRFSKNCFIAMSFDEDDLKEIYEKSIIPVLEDRYTPIIISRENYESDKTINDAMIASIKKSKFMIADFTKQKRNVYFEAGYALGRGMQVIFSCRKDYFDNHEDINKMSAFDTNHFPHIIWKDTEDFKKQLKDRIEAYIE